SQLAEAFPHHAETIHAINDRIVDLMTPFKSKWYDDPRFNGSASIKYVLPVVCPELSYAELDIKDGSTAQRMWMSVALDQQSTLDRDKVFRDLRTYCELDTWAMVRIWQNLVDICSASKA